jgi:hypothetical protein
MRLGAAYNVFDGLELLEGSIDSIRPVVDFVCAVYQTVSNTGQRATEDILTELERLRALGKIQEILLYTPTLGDPQFCEFRKRKSSLNLLRRAKCTHFMTIDVDEYYDSAQLDYAKMVMVQENLQTTACQTLTYYRSGEYIYDPPEEAYVPLIYKLDSREIVYGTAWPVMVDPTRRMPPGKIKLFERSQIQMHHFAYVRKDIRRKLSNSSSSFIFKNRLEDIAQHYENWKPGDPCLVPTPEPTIVNLKKVENKFGVKDILS